MRKLVLDFGIWQWKVGRSNVVIQSPEKKKIVVDFSKLTGFDWSTIERGIYKRYFKITPQCIREYIETKILKGFSK